MATKRRAQAAEDKRLDGKPARPTGASATRDGHAAPIWEVLAELGKSVPAEDLDRLPTDLARNVDHYLYGAPKRG